MNDDNVIVFAGDTVKSLGSRRIGGFAVLFTGPTDLDQQGEFFSSDTDFWEEPPITKRLIYAHGQDRELRTRKLADATLTVQPQGLWAEAEFKRMDELEEQIMGAVNRGALGFSTGSANHLVQRERVGAAVAIKSWPISELSITLRPAEARNIVMALKSLEPAPFSSLLRRDYNARAEHEWQRFCALRARFELQCRGVYVD